MKDLQKNQSGIAALTIVGLLLILGVVGFTGWRVWEARKDATKKLDTGSTQSGSSTKAKKETEKKEQKPTYQVPAGFVEFSNTTAAFKFAYPKSWGSSGGLKASNDLFYVHITTPTNTDSSVEVRGHSAGVDFTNSDSQYARGFVVKNGKYYMKTKADHESLIEDKDIIAKVSSGLGEVIITKGQGMHPPEGSAHLMINLPDGNKYDGLTLTLNRGYDGQITADDISNLKQAAATFFPL